MTLSRKILTAVALSVPLLSFAAPAAIDLDGTFNLTSNPNIFESTTVTHTTVQGTLNDVNDVAWYSFTGQAGQRFWADHDDSVNGDTLTDSVLSLFDANGNLLAIGDDGDVDVGSANGGNAFAGVYTLPSSGVFYLALSSFGNVPDVSGCEPGTSFAQPDGSGVIGTTYGQCSVNFAFQGGGTGAGSFTLHVSLGDVGTAVPEPGSLSLAGLALAGLALRRRRRR